MNNDRFLKPLETAFFKKVKTLAIAIKPNDKETTLELFEGNKVEFVVLLGRIINCVFEIANVAFSQANEDKYYFYANSSVMSTFSSLLNVVTDLVEFIIRNRYIGMKYIPSYESISKLESTKLILNKVVNDDTKPFEYVLADDKWYSASAST